jgi:hypothetical protein
MACKRIGNSSFAAICGRLRKEVPAAELSEIFKAVHMHERRGDFCHNFALAELRKTYPRVKEVKK